MLQPFHTYSLNLHGRLVTIDRPWVMGIINVTPDSFYSGSRVNDERSLIERVRQMLDEGADVLDVGAARHGLAVNRLMPSKRWNACSGHWV